MNKKGFTTVELIVSFTLTAIIVIFLFELVLMLKDIYVNSGIKVKLVTKEATINSIINEDFKFKTLISANKNGNEVTFVFDDGTKKTLSYNKANETISYGDYTTKLISGSKFGNILITTEVSMKAEDFDYEKLNGILNIKLPIYHSLIEKEDFGINVVHLYNSNKTSISGLRMTDLVESEKEIRLNNVDDNSNTIWFKGIEYVEPGYTVLDKDNQIQNDSNVKITGFVDTKVNGSYYLTYTLYDMNNNVMDQKIRTINVIDSEYVYSYPNKISEFEVPVTGKYELEVWGASGGGSSLMRGNAGYSYGIFKLNKGEKLYIYLGDEGSLSTGSSAALGGYNGGGNSGTGEHSAGSGGGATHIAITTNRGELKNYVNNKNEVLIVAGGGGGAGSRNDSVATCTGGAAGGINGYTGTCSSNDYLGQGATSLSGGAAASYKTDIKVLPTSGSFGLGGNGATYLTTHAAGGGGGGYYGGGGGARYGGGGGGSGYCSSIGTLCKVLSGNGDDSFPMINSSKYEYGHVGKGHARIKLISIESNLETQAE